MSGLSGALAVVTTRTIC
ncbi:chloramphenicol resistance leader peptide [Arthrobacter sp. 31Y]